MKVEVRWVASFSFRTGELDVGILKESDHLFFERASHFRHASLTERGSSTRPATVNSTLAPQVAHSAVITLPQRGAGYGV